MKASYSLIRWFQWFSDISRRYVLSFTNRKIKEDFGLFYWWKCNARFDGNERPSKRDVNFASEKWVASQKDNSGKSKVENTLHGFARARTVRIFHVAVTYPETGHKGNDADMKAISRMVCMEAQESLRFDRKSWMLLARKNQSVLSSKRERRKRNRIAAGSVPPMREWNGKRQKGNIRHSLKRNGHLHVNGIINDKFLVITDTVYLFANQSAEKVYRYTTILDSCRFCIVIIRMVKMIPSLALRQRFHGNSQVYKLALNGQSVL